MELELNKISVLIVDDNEAERYILKRMFQETDLELKVFELGDGQSAVEFFKNHEGNRAKHPQDYPPLVIFLDINMPVLNGFEFLEQFKLIRIEHSIDTSLILMFTSSNREEDKKKALSYDYVKAYLVKGEFTSEQLQEEVEKLTN